MVDLSGGPDGPIEHGFSNTVFIIPAIVVIGLAGKALTRSPRGGFTYEMAQSTVDRSVVQEQLDGLGRIEDGLELPKDFMGEAPPVSVEDLLKTLENLEGVSAEDKLSLTRELLKAMGEEGDAAVSGSSFGPMLLFVLAAGFVFSVLAFFGMKLYRSLSERERKRDEKRRLKQQKKKK